MTVRSGYRIDKRRSTCGACGVTYRMSVQQNSFTHLTVLLVLTDRGIIISRSKSPIAPPSVQALITAVINVAQLEQDGDLHGLVRVLENAKADAAAILETFVGATSASKAPSTSPSTIDVAQLERDGDIRGLVRALEDAKAGRRYQSGRHGGAVGVCSS
jgi:hypothetical protein